MLSVRKANPGVKRGKRRLLETVFAGVASISLLATGLASAAYAVEGDESQSGGEPVAVEPLAITPEDTDTQSEEQPESATSEANDSQSEEATSPAPEQDEQSEQEPPVLAAAGELNSAVKVDISMKTTGGTPPVKVGDKLEVTAEFDASDANVESGEYFTLQIPDELAFSLTPGKHYVDLPGVNGAGENVSFGRCEIDTDTKIATCTFNDNVYSDPATKTRWDSITGGIKFTVEAVASTDETELTFEVNGEPVEVEVPGGGGIEPNQPSNMSKRGDWISGSSNTAIRWTISVPGQLLINAAATEGTPVRIFDTLPAGMKLCDATPNAGGWTAPDGPRFRATPTGTEFTAPTYNDLPSGATFGINVNEPAGGFNRDRSYTFTYDTCTVDGKQAPTGTVYTNAAEIPGSGAEGVGVGVTQPVDPDATTKSGAWIDGSRNSKLRWSVQVPNELLAGANTSFNLYDTISGDQKLCVAPTSTVDGIKVYRQYGGSGGAGNRVDITDSVNITENALAPDLDPTKSFNVDIARGTGSFSDWDNPDNAWVYVIQYETCVTDADGNILPEGTTPDSADGKTFSNAANAAGATATGSQTLTRNASKTGLVNLSVDQGSDKRVVAGIPRNQGSTIDWRVVIPGDKIPMNGQDLVLTDVFGPGHGLCSAAEGTSVNDRLELKIVAVDQYYNMDNYPRNNTLPPAANKTGNVQLDNQPLSGTASELPTFDGVQFEIPVPTLPDLDGQDATGFSKEYKYVITYTTCTTDGRSVTPDQQLTNDLSGVQTGVEGTATNEQTIEGWANGLSSLAQGGFGVAKVLTDDSTAKGMVPPNTKFTVMAQLYRGETAVGDPVPMEVPLGGGFEPGPFAQGAPYSVVLTELAPPAIPGVVWGDYAFQAGPGVTLSDNGKTARFDLISNGVVEVTLANKADFLSGGVSVTKVLTGNGANAVPADTEYDVTATFETPSGVDPIAPRNIKIKNGETQALTGLPVDTRVTFSEVKPADGNSVAWSDPVISPNPVIVPEDEEEPVLVTITNTATLTVEPKIDLIKTKVDQGDDWEPKRGDDKDTVDAGVQPIIVKFTNTGTEALKDLVFTDSTQSGADVQWESQTQPFKGDTYPVALGEVIPGLVLEPGDSVVIRGTVEVKFGEVHTDTAKIDGVGIFSGIPVDAEDPTTYEPREPEPKIDLIKTKVDQGDNWEPKRGDDKDSVKPGTHPIIAKFTNTGEEALKDLVFNDTTTAGQTVVWEKTATASDGKTYAVELGKPIEGLVLQPGESVVVKGSVKVEAGKPHSDTASIDGVGVISGKSVNAKDDTTYTASEAPKPLPKTGAAGVAVAGIAGLGLLGLGAMLVRRQKRA